MIGSIGAAGQGAGLMHSIGSILILSIALLFAWGVDTCNYKHCWVSGRWIATSKPCRMANDDCSHLDFSTMPVKRIIYDDDFPSGRRIVRCTAFARRGDDAKNVSGAV